jgi:hypothetical protein
MFNDQASNIGIEGVLPSLPARTSRSDGKIACLPARQGTWKLKIPAGQFFPPET